MAELHGDPFDSELTEREISSGASPLATGAGAWYAVPHHYRVRCGPGHVSNNKHTSTCGIYQSKEGSKSDLVSLFYIDKMRRYPGDPALFDVNLHNPQTDERIEVTRAGAGDIAQAIHTRSGSPHAPLTQAVYAILSGMCMDIDRGGGGAIKD